MGGLAVRVPPHSTILIEASPPSEIQGFHPEAALNGGTFDPELVYGRFPTGIRARPESSLARAKRKGGISVPTLPCPALVIYGDEFRNERSTALVRPSCAWFARAPTPSSELCWPSAINSASWSTGS